MFKLTCWCGFDEKITLLFTSVEWVKNNFNSLMLKDDEINFGIFFFLLYLRREPNDIYKTQNIK